MIRPPAFALPALIALLPHDPPGSIRHEHVPSTGAGVLASPAPRPSDGPVILGSGAHTYEWVPGWGTLPEGMQYGNTHGCIAFDASGNVYVNTDSDNAVIVFDPQGRFLRAWGQDLRAGLHGMTVRKEGEREFLYLAHTARHEVIKTTLAGEVIWSLGWPEAAGKYQGAGEYAPTSVAVAPDGSLFVGDGYGKSWVHQFDANRKYVRSFGGPGTEPGQMQTPHGLLIDGRGTEPVLLVADRENHRIQRFDLQGRLLGMIATELRRPCNLDTREGDLLVADLAGRVSVFDREDHLIVHLGDNPDPAKRAQNGIPREQWRDGEFISPHSARWDSRGDIYVLDWLSAGRVSKLRHVKTPPPAPMAVVPTPQQVAWQRRELALFAHFGPNTFTDREWGEGKEDPKIFDPKKLDARQWARAAKTGGFMTVILTAKHHDGFCLWPSRHTDHSVKSSPWKDGQGDVVREMVDACRAEELEVGLYLSPWDRHEPSYGDSPKYNDHYCSQLAELLSQYGPIAEVWFDGACGEGPNGKKQEYDWKRFHALVKKLQPDALIFSDAGPDIRWIGNESGSAGDPNWSSVDPKTVPYAGASGDDVIRSLQHGDPNGSVWRPGECDVSIRPGWFWHPAEDGKVRSVENLVDLYFQSVGRNSLLLLNVPPTRDGLLHENDVRRLAEFRKRLDQLFAVDLARGRKAAASGTRGNDAAFGPERALDGDPDSYWCLDDDQTSGWIEVDLGAPATFTIACTQESIRLGQRVESYSIEAWIDGTWKKIAGGTTIGNKKLDRFAPVTAQKVRLVVEKALACPTIGTFALYRGS